MLLDLTGGQLAERFTGFGPALDVACASAMDTADHPEWQGVEAVLLRPDGHIEWVGPDASAKSATSLLRALAGWRRDLVIAVPRRPDRYPTTVMCKFSGEAATAGRERLASRGKAMSGP